MPRAKTRSSGKANLAVGVAIVVHRLQEARAVPLLLERRKDEHLAGRSYFRGMATTAIAATTAKQRQRTRKSPESETVAGRRTRALPANNTRASRVFLKY